MANMNPNRPGPQTGNKQDTHTHIQRNLRSNLKVKKRKFNFCLASSCGHAACDIGPVSSASFAPGEASRGAGSDGQSGEPQDGRTARRKRWHCLLTSFGLARLGQIVLVSVDCLRRVSLPDIRGRGGGPTLKSGSEFLEQGHMD